MPQLLVRNIETAVVQKLRQKAAREGISMEEEHRRILRKSLLGRSKRPKKTFKAHLVSISGALQETRLVRSKEMPRPVDL